MKRSITLCLAVVAAVFAVTAVSVVTRADSGSPVTITLPPPNNDLKPGPNLAVAQANCLVCHSADYIYTQPPLTQTQWTAEVTKMKKVYAAQIDDANIPLIVQYLMSQNGKPG